jgi:hypothetical protein
VSRLTRASSVARTFDYSSQSEFHCSRPACIIARARPFEFE